MFKWFSYGAAELKSRVKANATPTCPLFAPACAVVYVPPYSASSSATRAAFGAGLQVKFARFAARAEYERISARGGDPDLISVGLSWRF